MSGVSNMLWQEPADTLFARRGIDSVDTHFSCQRHSDSMEFWRWLALLWNTYVAYILPRSPKTNVTYLK